MPRKPSVTDDLEPNDEGAKQLPGDASPVLVHPSDTRPISPRYRHQILPCRRRGRETMNSAAHRDRGRCVGRAASLVLCGDMRRLPLLLPILLLVACKGTQAYSKTDLRQVKHGYSTIAPVYLQFHKAYFAGDTRRIVRLYHREQRDCRIVDVVDRRDTIDPNVNLFAVSAGLDDMCNAIESAYAGWAKQHGYPYDKSVELGRPEDVFIQADADWVKMPDQMKHPAALS